MAKHGEKTELPRVNFRPLVFCALGLLFGVFLYFRVRLGGLKPSDFLFLTAFLACAVFPLSWKRIAAILLALVLFGGAGALAAHVYTRHYLSGPARGEYAVIGTVESFSIENGSVYATLGDLYFDGVPVGGKLTVMIAGENARAGDVVAFENSLSRNGLPDFGNRSQEYLFYNDIRYECSSVGYEKIAESGNALLRLKTALFDCLDENMGGTEAEVAFALLTGSSRNMDEGLTDEVRTGGIAHIFAVSGLHIGILFGAAMLVFRPLKKYAVLPSVALAAVYCAFCGFTISSVRAVVMCAVMGLYRAFGRKYDFLQSISLAAIVVLLLFPADFLSAGFRLSFGACVGLALFSGSLSRLFGRIPKFPAFLAKYLSANLSVQLFTLPILLDTFGYFSLWGFLLNLVFIPLLPVFFLVVLLFSLFALCIPPAAVFFLALPKGLLSLFLLILSAAEFTAVVTGFSLGAGSAVWLTGSVLLSEKIRLRAAPRSILAALLAVLFTLAAVAENVVFTGGKVVVFTGHSGCAALVQTPSAHVLVIDDGISLEDCREFLSKRYAGKLDAVFVTGENELLGINRAAFLDAETVYAKDEIATGLRDVNIEFGESAEVGGLTFTFVSRQKLFVGGEDVLIEVDFSGGTALGADFFVHSGCGGLIFFFENGIIKVL